MKQQGTRNIFFSVILSIVVQIFLLQNAFAYLDPGTGSYIFQVFIAAVIGGLFTIKIYWRKIKDSVFNRFSKKQKK